MSAAISVTFKTCTNRTNYEDEVLCTVEMSSVPATREEVTINGQKYGVMGRNWEIMPESDMQAVTVMLQER